jgi:class 3 adenylate cyclase
MPNEFTNPAAQPSPLTRADVAQRSGVDAAFIDRMCELGILSAGSDGAFREGDVRRARIVHALDAAGLPVEAIGEATRLGFVDLGFVDEPAYGLFAGLTDVTFRQLAERTRIPIEVLLTVREAMGSPQPAPEDRVRELEMDAIPAIQLQVERGIRPEIIDRTLRAYGESLRRMAEVEADWWMNEVLRPILASGVSIAEVGPLTAQFSNDLMPLAERQVIALYRGQQSQSWMKNFFEGFEAGMARAGLYKPVARPPAICFLDLSGYTRLTEERGDSVAADLAARLSRLVQRTSGKHGGKPVKWLGDGVMFHFRDPGPGVLAALEMVEGAREEDLPPAHVGLHAGPVLFQEGDYFGRTVNTAARIADFARRGEVLVTDEVVAATTIGGVEFESLGPVELKGLSGAIPLHVARRAGEAGSASR